MYFQYTCTCGICELLICTCIYTTVPYKLYMVENHLIFHMRRNPVIFWKLLHIYNTYGTHTSLDGWGDYKQDKCFSCGCNVTAGSANTWVDTVRSCIRMCDHIPGRPPRLSAVTLDKTLSNHVLYLKSLVCMYLNVLTGYLLWLDYFMWSSCIPELKFLLLWPTKLLNFCFHFGYVAII